MLAQHFNTQTKAKVTHFWHPGNSLSLWHALARHCFPCQQRPRALLPVAALHITGRINGAISYLLWCSSAARQTKMWTVPGAFRAAQEESSIACFTVCTFNLFVVRNLLTLNHCTILSSPRFLHSTRKSVSAHLLHQHRQPIPSKSSKGTAQ